MHSKKANPTTIKTFPHLKFNLSQHTITFLSHFYHHP